MNKEQLMEAFEQSILKMSQKKEPPRSSWSYDDMDVEVEFLIFCEGYNTGNKFVVGMAQELQEARDECNAKQAEIDRLMLEFCPGEMTEAQMKTWEASQRRVEKQNA